MLEEGKYLAKEMKLKLSKENFSGLSTVNSGNLVRVITWLV